MQRIAGWNSARDVWETDQIDLLSGRSVVYSETFTISGSMRNGVAYALPTSGRHMEGSGSLFSQLGGKLPDGALVFDTPDTMPDAPNSGSNRKAQPAGLGNQVKLLLPTPRSNEANGIGVHGDGGNDLRTTVSLLPTPLANEPRGRTREGHEAHASSRSGDLTGVVLYELLPPPEWGQYAAAIQRWEAELGRPAPEPTELGPKGGRRLSSAFVEWMMALPEGWVNGLGLPRTAELRMLGNGVVPKQAIAALRMMRAARSINEGETNHD